MKEVMAMRNRTILVVDDEKDTLTLLKTELSLEGYQVIEASSGKEGFTKAQNFLPDLILMDVVMPDMNGGQAIKLLKETPKTKNIPVIFLTAMLTREEEKSGKKDVVIDGMYYSTIAKPFNSQELIEEVNKMMHVL